MKRIVSIIVLIAVASCQSTDEETSSTPVARVVCAPVQVRSWSDTRQLRGSVIAQPDRDAIVSAQVPGRLMRVALREGDAVKQGAVIAEVEPDTLRDSLHQAQALLSQARAQLAAATSTATREKHLFERGISARQSFEVAHAAQMQAEGAVGLALSQVDVARRNLGRSAVRAPLSGVVVKLIRREGEVVDGTPATPIVEIADPKALEFLTSVSARDLVVLKLHQTANITLEAIDEKTFPASVQSVAPVVDPVTGVGTARLRFDAQDLILPLGLVGTADVAIGPAHQVTVVPDQAIRNAGGTQTEVVLCEGGHARPLAVVVGTRRNQEVELISGLEGVSKPIHVAIEGLTGLDEGMTIEATP